MAFVRRKMPSLQELVAFEAVARCNSFTKAAEELALTQSAISKQIRNLEETLGLILFERAGGRIGLTAAGLVYLKAAQEILTQFRTAALSIGGGIDGEPAVNVIVLPTFAELWLLPRLPRFAAEHPNVTVNLTTRVEPYDFYGASYDVAIHYGTANWSHPDATLICEEEFIPLASPAYRKQQRLATAADLSRAVLIQQANRPGLWGDWFAGAGIERENPHRGPVFDRFSMTKIAALSGLGVALIPRFLVEDDIVAGQLVALSEWTLVGAGAYHAVVPRAKAYAPHTSAFHDWLLREASESTRRSRDATAAHPGARKRRRSATGV